MYNTWPRVRQLLGWVCRNLAPNRLPEVGHALLCFLNKYPRNFIVCLTLSTHPSLTLCALEYHPHNRDFLIFQPPHSVSVAYKCDLTHVHVCKISYSTTYSTEH